MSDLGRVPHGHHPIELGGQVSETPWSVPLRVSEDTRQLNAWALVLVSRGLHPVVHWVGGVFELHVPHHELAVARVELDASDAEEREAERAVQADAAREQRPVSKRAGVASALMSLLLLAFFAVTGPRAGGAEWFGAGASDAERVLHGEWWRTITALTLHADSAHVLSNMGVGALVVGAVMRSEGVGFGAALVLASGSAGNWLNAWAHQSLHRSVGFSTAVFGAIGILGGLTYMQRRSRVSRRLPPWTALVGSLALLALLGTGGERTDLLAHLFGALAGVALGLMVGWSRWRPRSAAGQWFAGLSTAATVAVAWLVALS